IYGDNVEHKLGRLGFLVAYLVTGVAATLSYAALAGNSMTPLVGASGAISGILGLYFILFPKNRVKIFVFLCPLLVTVWHVPARIVLALYLLADNLLPLVLGADSGVAYGAHIGGFVAGVVLAVSGRAMSRAAGWLKKAFGPRQVVKKVPRSNRPDPRTVIIDAEYVDDVRN
ncbi:MAG TPA: rhomboid family intramembrane serine protease, partial [Myxococcota bacterium]|nr:rhomboid family intramembrane serine protease [Myxococcota bacterium]